MPRIAPEIRVAQSVTDVAMNAALEVVAIQLDGVSTENLDEDVVLIGFMEVLTAALTTALTARIRRGNSIAGTLVGEAAAVPAGASVITTAFQFARDNPGIVAGQSYVLTLQPTGPAANGTILHAELLAFIGAQST
jgi:hypothetical protein